jgi:hypothetical protein
VTVNHPYGAIDQVSVSGSSVTFWGWADDKDVDGSIDVRVGLGQQNVVERADGVRPDVDAVHRRGANKGFSGRIDGVPDGAHQLCVIALNVGGGVDRPLGCKSVVVETVRGGYELLGLGAAAPSMDVYLHTSAAAIEALMPSAVRDFASATGNTYAYRGLTSSRTPRPGQTIVHASNAAGCSGNGWVGCAELSSVAHGSSQFVVNTALLTIKPAYLAHPEVREVLMHELAHSGGLGHFDDPYLGSLQVMMWRMNGQTEYQRGDLNGLAHNGAEGRKALQNPQTATAIAHAGPTVVIAD